MTGAAANWQPDARLVEEVEAQFARAISAYRANPHLVAEHANHEESIRVGGYANRTLLELVQNAADAMAGVADGGRVEIVLDPENKILYCANEGRPFSRQGLISIEHAHLSGKRGDEIGRFGLGFKSVLAVSDRPQVFSRSVSFEFNSSAARAAIAAVGSGATRIPILRTATVVDPDEAMAEDHVLAELGEWAVTTVRLPSISNIARLRSDIADFASEFLLFVTSVREIRLRVLGDDGFTVSHVSRPMGRGTFRIENPDGEGSEWLVADRMHHPSPQARHEVGEAVSRDEVKITIAVPMDHGDRKIGEFWSYFPLQDRTTASGLFNAPWSVNDDRTTLLRNQYNTEILESMAEMLVEVFPSLMTADDPARHFDYMPARGRESRSFGDDVLCDRVPRCARGTSLVPDATGALVPTRELLPLAFDAPVADSIQRVWSAASHTPSDVPHWRCYANQQRLSRLRQIFVGEYRDASDFVTRSADREIQAVPQRGLLTWLRIWASGDPESAANALRFVRGHRSVEEIDKAPVVPTTEGLRSLRQNTTTFLRKEPGLEFDGAAFVDPEFLAVPEVEDLLRELGFSDLDPAAILSARIAALSPTSSEIDHSLFWDAALDVSPGAAKRVLDRSEPQRVASIRVPTKDGGWNWPAQTLDIDQELGEGHSHVVLDRIRCVPELALKLGVVSKPLSGYAFEDEFLADRYYDAILHDLNDQLGPGERPIERIEVYPPSAEKHVGPFSVLLLLKDANAPVHTRVEWTLGLLGGGADVWDCEDLATGVSHRVRSPARWAVGEAGLVLTSLGAAAPSDAVSPALVQFGEVLPLFQGPRAVGERLALPSDVGDIAPHVLKNALSRSTLTAPIPHAALVDFVVEACGVAYGAEPVPSILAQVGRAIEARPPGAVFVATTDEQRDYLAQRHKPHLMATGRTADDLVELVGCRRFEDAFSFSVVVDGRQSGQRLLDIFTGLRPFGTAAALGDASVTRAASITKLVTTEDGVESKVLDWHRDGHEIVVSTELDKRRELKAISEAFELRLTNDEIQSILDAGLAHELELMRQEARAATSDAERLECFFGGDDLRDQLPHGLWQALSAQGLVDSSTSVAELFITVYGSDSVKQLAEGFSGLGFTDVPGQWAGSPITVSWLRKMGFGAEYGGRRSERRDPEFLVPGATVLNPLHDFQQDIRAQLVDVLTLRDEKGNALKAMVELPTGAGKTRVASETVLRLFSADRLRGPVLWIAQSQELCEQAVQTWSSVWRGLRDERPLSIGRLWENNEVHEPDTEFSVVVATDAKLRSIIERDTDEYEWLADATAVIIDEGHRAGGSQLYTKILQWLDVAGHGHARPLVGLSATPFKGTSKDATDALVKRFGGRKIDAFHGNAYEQLAELGVLARVSHQVLPGVDVHLTAKEEDEATRLRRISPTVLGAIGASHARNQVLVDHILGLDPSWPVLVFTPSVLSAQLLAATLRYRKVDAAAVSGQTGRQERRDVIEKFKHGEIRVLANCDLLVQGFDAPAVRALYIARPTFSPNAYIQMAGRGLRGPENGGKEECLIVDMADNFEGTDANGLLGFHEYEELWRRQDA